MASVPRSGASVFWLPIPPIVMLGRPPMAPVPEKGFRFSALYFSAHPDSKLRVYGKGSKNWIYLLFEIFAYPGLFMSTEFFGIFKENVQDAL